MNEQNASMDEILSSIRDIVKEEAGGDDAPAVEAAAPAAAAEETSAPAEEAASDDDIEAMMAAAQAEGEGEADDVLELTETVDESNTQTTEETAAEVAPEETLAEEPAPVVEPAADEAPAPSPKAAAPAAEQVFLNAMPSAKGLQLAFPVEVLAEALRPLVKDWVSANLPDIVERLVREELSRLVDKK